MFRLLRKTSNININRIRPVSTNISRIKYSTENEKVNNDIMNQLLELNKTVKNMNDIIEYNYGTKRSKYFIDFWSIGFLLIIGMWIFPHVYPHILLYKNASRKIDNGETLQIESINGQLVITEKKQD